MSDESRAAGFADALQEFERSGEVDDLVSWFAPDAELRRPEVEVSSGHGGTDASAFWKGYLSPFTHIATTFVSVREAGPEAVLEWESSGELSTGRPIDYTGVSLLTFDGGDQISRFATYFDTAAFLRPEDIGSTSH